jgi:hypothetical protein
MMRRLLRICALVLSVMPPQIVAQQLPGLKQLDRFDALPAAIQSGNFTVDGASAKGWKMAEPGGAFSATDVPVPGAPGRRLIFAGCSASVCVVHYERGGIAHFYEILGLALGPKGWSSVWNIIGSKAIANLDVLRAMIDRSTLGGTWHVQPVKGDF